MRYFRKRLFAVAAVQRGGDNFDELLTFTEAHFARHREDPYTAAVYDTKHDAWIPLVMRGIDGEFYPCNEDVFARTYEFVEER